MRKLKDVFLWFVLLFFFFSPNLAFPQEYLDCQDEEVKQILLEGIDACFRENYPLAEERFRLGGATMLEQIDSQVALSEARTSYVEALYDYLLSQADLVRAMGKD